MEFKDTFSLNLLDETVNVLLAQKTPLPAKRSSSFLFVNITH